MAAYDITSQANELIEMGVTEAELLAVHRRIEHYGDVWEAQSRAAESAFDYFYDTRKKAAERKATGTPAGQLATPRQVEFIMDLIHRGAHEEGGFMTGPTTRDEVAKMSRQAASGYITSLQGRY